MKEGIYCAKCDKEMKISILPRYEYEEGLPLHNVQTYKCHSCGKTFFTEEQAKEMEARTNEIKEYQFGFERRITVSGRSLAVTIPVELAEHLHIKQGQKVKIFPIAKDGLMIRRF